MLKPMTPRPTTPPPLGVYDLMFLGHEAVQKELGLDADAAKKASALSRGSTWAASANAPRAKGSSFRGTSPSNGW